jgi:hypothetical protein
MRYQLVLQFEGDDEDTLEKVIALEDDLIESLGDAAEVDGHEVGDGTCHLSIMTGNPKKLWERLEPIVESAAGEDLEIAAVAYRPADAEEFTVLWPEDYEGDFVVA